MDITCGMEGGMPPAQPHGKYLFEVVGWMSSPCIKFHFQISNLTSPAPMMNQLGFPSAFSTTGRVGVDKRPHDGRVAGQLEPKWQTSHLLLSHRKPAVFFHDITCGMEGGMPRAQPHGKYLFEVVGRMSSPCIKFHFQISNLKSHQPCSNDESAGIFVSFLHLLALALTVCI